MACGDCTEFLIQGSGMVGSGSALAYEKVINFFDSDNIPLTVRSVEVLTKNGSPLIDTTPSWFGFEITTQSLLIDGVITYRLTVTIQIDAVVAGEGTYNIRVCARVVDDSKAQVCCSFNVCITASQAGLIIANLYIGRNNFPNNRELWGMAIPNLADPTVNPMTLFGNWSAGSCGWSASNLPRPTHFHPALRLILIMDKGAWLVDRDDFITCPVASVPEGAGNVFRSGQFDWIRDRVYYLGSDSELRYTKRDGTEDTLLADLPMEPSAFDEMLEYDDTTDLLYVASQSGDCYQIHPVTGAFSVVISGITSSGGARPITLDKEHQEVLESINFGIRRWSISTGLSSDLTGITAAIALCPRWHVAHQRYYWFDNGDQIERCDYVGGNIEVAGKRPGSGFFPNLILAGFDPSGS